jgi:hypothetical protein
VPALDATGRVRTASTGVRPAPARREEPPVTDPEATEADRQEQQESVSPEGPELADEATAPADDVPEADALDQQLTATPGRAASLRSGDPEADEADVLEQQAVVGDDEDDQRNY